MQVLIFGGYINNKGAQSMLFTVVDKIKKKNPEAKIFVVTEQNVAEKIKDIYNFNFLEINIKTKLKISEVPFSMISRLIKGKADEKQRKNFIENIENADLIIDISGFALSSKFTKNNTLNYLSNISLAKKYDVPMYLLPQSFGPFNYKFPENIIMMRLMKKYLKYPNRIYAREKEGLNFLENMGLKNIEHSVDTVFKKDENFKTSNIYKKNVNIRTLEIKNNSVGVIPNNKLINTHNEEEILNMYVSFIKKLIEKEKNIYLLRHSTEDLYIIQNIYKKFKSEKNVHLIEEEYSALELQIILSEFDFLIASRYHSIVHGYSVGTPALVIGWAIKYVELTREFKQENFQFNIENLILNDALEKLELLNSSFEKESKVIKERVLIEKINNFDYIFDNEKGRDKYEK